MAELLDDPTRFAPGEKAALEEVLASFGGAFLSIGARLDRIEGVLHLRETSGSMASSVKEKPGPKGGLLWFAEDQKGDE